MNRIHLNSFLIFLIAYFICFNKSYSQIQYPTSIAGLECWYAADSGVTVNSNSITQMIDLSNNGHSISQTQISAQPTLILNNINNKPSINFDGTEDFLPIAGNIDFRTILVLGVASESTFSDYRGLLGGIGSGVGVGGYLINGNLGTTTLVQGIFTSNFSKILHNQNDVTPTGDFAPIDNYWFGVFEFNANRTQTADIGRIDAGTQANRYWKGNIAEILVFNKQLTNSELDIIGDYISSKYATKPNLGPDLNLTSNSLCGIDLSLSSPFIQYIWNTNETTSTIHVNQPGKYWVKAKNEFGFFQTDTISISYSDIFSFPNDTLFCAASSIVWNTSLSKNLFSFQWSDNSTDSLLVISQPGLYSVRITDTNNCFIDLDTINVTQDNFPSTPLLGTDTSMCAGNLIHITIANQPNITYQWGDSSTNTSLTINSSGQYTLIAKNINNCIAKDTINIIVVGQAPIAGFQNSLSCINNSIAFNDTSIASSGNTITQWFWNFGDSSATNDTAIVSQPNYTFADTGLYTINLTVTTDVGCKQNLTKTLHVYPKPIVDFINAIACQNDSTFFNDVINILGYPITNYQWNFGDALSGANNTATNSDPFHVFSQNTNYQVQLIATNNKGCADSISKTITIKDEVSANFNYSIACINIPITFTDNSIVPAPNISNIRNWSFYPGSATGLSATKTFSSAGAHPITLKVSGVNGCISIFTDTIQVYLPPDADFLSSTICIADSFQLTDASNPINGNLNSWLWKYSGSTFSNQQNPKFLLNSSGSKNIFLQVTNDFGCKDTLTKSVHVNPLPNANFNIMPSTYLFIDSAINFTPNQQSATSYFWTLSNGNTFSDPNLTLSFTSEDTYTIGLQLTDNFGCKNNSSQSFTIARRNTDLGIIAARSTIDNDGFVGVEADLYNYGTAPITQFEILYELTGGGIMKETWATDTLPPEAILLFKFSSKTFLTINERENAISCITIQTVNSNIDDNSTNNENCAALNSDKQLIAEPYPNPADGDVTLPIVLTEDQTINISIYDYLGKLIVENLSYDGVTGLNFFKIPSAPYSSGTYTLKITISDSNFVRKLIKQGSSK